MQNIHLHKEIVVSIAKLMDELITIEFIMSTIVHVHYGVPVYIPGIVYQVYYIYSTGTVLYLLLVQYDPWDRW